MFYKNERQNSTWMDKNDLYKPINKIFCAKHMQQDTQFREN